MKSSGGWLDWGTIISVELSVTAPRRAAPHRRALGGGHGRLDLGLFCYLQRVVDFDA